MSRKMLRAGVALAVFGLVGVVGDGVAVAHGANSAGGKGAAHGEKAGSSPRGTSTPGGGAAHGGKGRTYHGGAAVPGDTSDVDGRGAPGTKGGTKGATSAPSGTTTCSVNAVVNFTPPLRATAGTSSSITFNAQLTRCSAVSGHGRTTGHVSGAVGSILSNLCASSSTITLPAITLPGLTIRWTPPARGNSTLTAPAGTASTITGSHGKMQFQIAYTGATVTGSFATGAGTATLDSNDPLSALSHACSGSGLGTSTFKGTATL